MEGFILSKDKNFSSVHGHYNRLFSEFTQPRSHQCGKAPVAMNDVCLGRIPPCAQIEREQEEGQLYFGQRAISQIGWNAIAVSQLLH